MRSVKGSGSIRCELMRQEGGEECQECCCLCRTPFSRLASPGRLEWIKAGRLPPPDSYNDHSASKREKLGESEGLCKRLRSQADRPDSSDPRKQASKQRFPNFSGTRRDPLGPGQPARLCSERFLPSDQQRVVLARMGLHSLACALAALLLALSSLEVASQDCSGQCQCASAPPECPPGVSLVQDGCGCCRVCAKQLGELCTERDPCDPHKGLFCDFGSPANRKIGVCTVVMNESSLLFAARDGAPCVFGGMVYRSGESFQSSCKYQCTCLDGAVGCVPLCSMDVRLPSPDCPYPRRVKLPGKCCEEWVCDEPKDKEQTAVGPALAAYRLEDTYGPDPSLMRANCLVQTTEWSACSKTCGMGISTRVTNDNAFCRLEKQSRLCMVRPCEADLEESIKKGKKCIRTPKISKPVKFELSGCTSVKTYRAKFCGVCTDGRCCTPHRTATLPVEFKCPDGEVMKKRMMFIKTCACHYNCPGDNDIFESVYYRKMYGDMA
ncbi:hypothetical protein lerEdw1_018024 [Lerista edwardsae]|nr:hypothetical protein lerEdw1_018024 [Lerista edwardsae]